MEQHKLSKEKFEYNNNKLEFIQNIQTLNYSNNCPILSLFHVILFFIIRFTHFLNTDNL